MRAIISLLLLCFSVVGTAQGPFATNRYFEFCVEDTDFCAIGVLDTAFGEFRIVVREPVYYTEDPGVRVEAVGNDTYNYMQKYAIAHMFKTKVELERTPEEQEILDEQAENVIKCLYLASACAVSIVDAIASAGLATPIAILACGVTALDCKAARRANLALEARRQEILKKIKEERERHKQAAKPSGPPPEQEPGRPRPPQRGSGGAAQPLGPQYVCREAEVGGVGIPGGIKVWPKEKICGWI